MGLILIQKGVKIVGTEAGVVSSAVELGRDTRVRRFRRDLWRPWRKKFQCLCCGEFTLDAVDYCDICTLCGWEDWYECHDSPSEEIRPNYISLDTARSILARFGPGACCEANWSHGKTQIADFEKMSPDELRKLRTARERVEGQ